MDPDREAFRNACRFGELASVLAMRVNDTGGATIAEPRGLEMGWLDEIVCLSPAHPELRKTRESRACLTPAKSGWWLDSPTCGSEDVMPLEISLNGGQPGGFSRRS